MKELKPSPQYPKYSETIDEMGDSYLYTWRAKIKDLPVTGSLMVHKTMDYDERSRRRWEALDKFHEAAMQATHHHPQFS